MRKKKWNYWCIYGDEILFSATISHLDYAAVCFVYFLEYETQRYFEKTITIPFGGKLKMPTQVLESVSFKNSEMMIDLLYIQNETHLSVSIPDFDGDVLRAKLIVQHPPTDETLNVVIPWNRKTFQFTGKHHILPTSGVVTIGTRRYNFSAEENFAVLDYGRGVWPRQAFMELGNGLSASSRKTDWTELRR